MKVVENKNLNNLINEKNSLQNQYVMKIDEINSYYWPFYKVYRDKLNIMKKIFVIVALIDAVSLFYYIFGEVSPIEFAIFLATVIIIITSVSIFFLSKISKQKKHISLLWDKSYKKALELKEQFINKVDNAAKEVPYIICLSENFDNINSFKEENKNKANFNDLFNDYLEELLATYKEKIKKDLGENASSAHYIEYYYEWGRKIENQS